MVALAVELAGTCQLKPGLEMLGHRLVQRRALGVAGFVGFGDCCRDQWGGPCMGQRQS